jgi:hypothetical protein
VNAAIGSLAPAWGVFFVFGAPVYPLMLFPRPQRLPKCLKPLKPNDPYRGRTAPLTSKRWILYIYSTNMGTECFKHGIYCPVFLLRNAVCFIILTYLVPVLFKFYIQNVLKLKKNNSGAKWLNVVYTLRVFLFKMQFVS